MVAGTEELFHEPTRLVLTENGTTYFLSRKRKLQRFRLLDQREEYGLQISDYAPKSLQKLVASGMIRKLQFPVVDAVAHRQTVIDYVKLLVYGMLYRHAALSAHGRTMTSILARDWNRHNPRLAVTDDGIGVPSAQMQRILASRQGDLERLKTLMVTSIRAGFRAKAAGDGNAGGGMVGNDHDWDKILTTAQRFVDSLDGHVWFLLIVHDGQAAARELFRTISNDLVALLAQSSVADYLSLMLMELMVHMQHGQGIDGDTSMDFGSLGIEPTELYLLTQLSEIPPRGSGTQPVRSRLHFLLSTGTSRFDALKADLDELAGDSSRRRRSIKHFYRAAGSGETNLSLYYMSFLEEACTRLGLSFDGFVRGEGENGLVNVVLTV